jgi:hypothetical protein
MGKLYLLAVRSDEEEFLVTHQEILLAVAPGRLGLQKKGARASTYVQQGYRRYVGWQLLAEDARIGLASTRA